MNEKEQVQTIIKYMKELDVEKMEHEQLVRMFEEWVLLYNGHGSEHFDYRDTDKYFWLVRDEIIRRLGGAGNG